MGCMLRLTRAFSPRTLGCFASLDGCLECVNAYISNRDPAHDLINIARTHHWDKSPHTHVWCTYHKVPVERNKSPRGTSNNFLRSRTPPRTTSTRAFRSHFNLSLAEKLEQKKSQNDGGGSSTHRLHSAQDTGTRPGLRRCRGGGSLPEPEGELPVEFRTTFGCRIE